MAPASRVTPSRPAPFESGYLFVLGAAVMWGTIGVFFTILHTTFGLSALAISFLRAGLGTVALVAALAIWRREALRLPRALLPAYLLFGLFGVAFFYVLNTEAVILTNVATASVLLYTAPMFVTLLAWRLWNEPLTLRKLAAVAAAVVGCALVARAYDPGALALNGLGVLVAASAGLTYALFTIFSKYLSTRASPLTTVTYSLVFGTLFLLPLLFLELPGLGPPGLGAFAAEPRAWLAMAGLCLGPTLGSYGLYNAALRTVPASVASVVATIEPIVAGIAGLVFFQQLLEPLQLVGAGVIIAAALSLTLQRHPTAQEEEIVRIDG